MVTISVRLLSESVSTGLACPRRIDVTVVAIAARVGIERLAGHPPIRVERRVHAFVDGLGPGGRGVVAVARRQTLQRLQAPPCKEYPATTVLASTIYSPIIKQTTAQVPLPYICMPCDYQDDIAPYVLFGQEVKQWPFIEK